MAEWIAYDEESEIGRVDAPNLTAALAAARSTFGWRRVVRVKSAASAALGEELRAIGRAEFRKGLRGKG